MKRLKALPLTETTYYILLALLEPGHGYLIMQKVEEMSQGDVQIAAGTMYGAIDSLLKLGWIVSVPSHDKRRKVYQTTHKGQEILTLEIQRLEKCLLIASKTDLKGEQ
ncbi:PadR family transcriptional regulator [Streptococcus pluranimalium]|uniref:PadR family transcriptional regulator n=1 Tax=Streptococcus pluranimalium TaxID=82348 RepID=UPI0039FD7657